jgi:hypothetical protein
VPATTRKVCWEGTGQHTRRTMLLAYAKRCCGVQEHVTQRSQSLGINIHTADSKQRLHEFCQDSVEFVQPCPATSGCLCFRDEAHFHLDGFVNKQNTKFWASENLHSRGDVSPSCKMRRVLCNQQTRIYWARGTCSICKMRSFR